MHYSFLHPKLTAVRESVVQIDTRMDFQKIRDVFKNTSLTRFKSLLMLIASFIILVKTRHYVLISTMSIIHNAYISIIFILKKKFFFFLPFEQIWQRDVL